MKNGKFLQLVFALTFYFFFQVKRTEEEFLEIAYSDISQLCGELIVLWNNFINLFIGKSEISQHLARLHHHQKVKRFSEAFFLIGTFTKNFIDYLATLINTILFSDHSRKSALDCVESIYGKYAALTDDLRNSNYLMSLPPLPVSCVDLDGDASTMPVIYEDIYKDDDMPTYIDSQQPTKRRHSFSKII